jgi:hypothetical protein
MDETGPNNPENVPPPDDFYVEDDLPADDQPSPQATKDEFDSKRIQNIAKLRRAAVRSRGYLLIGSAFCAVLAIQMIWNSVGRFRGGSNVVGAAYLMAASILFALAWRAFVRAQQFKKEANATALADPKSPPDFSKLSDGSQSWKNLEDL